MKRKYLLYGFTIIILTLTVISFFDKDKIFSEFENRNLKSKAKFSVEKFINGKFQEEYEEYINDQIPLRDEWISIKSMSEYLLGKIENNGIIYGRNKRLFEKFDSFNEERLKNNVEAISKFSEKYIDKVSLMIVPNSYEIYREDLPKGSQQVNQTEIINKIYSKLIYSNNINVLDEFINKKNEYIYYNTDHHWTTYGASAAFKELAKQMDIPYEEDDFEAYTVHAKFQGTMMSSSGFYSGTKDTIDLYLPKEPETILVTNKEAQTTATTIYSEEGLLGNDPYEVFLGGNYGLLNIQTSSQSGRKLLLLKDSYANAMIGFLTPYFSEIDIVDPRYYSSDLDMQIAVNKYTDLLILYNLQSFAKDSSLALVLGEEAAE